MQLSFTDTDRAALERLCSLERALTPTEQDQFRSLEAAYAEHERAKAVEAEREKLRLYAGGSLTVDTSSVDRDPFGDPADTHTPARNPWQGRSSNETPRETLSRALSAVEATPGMDDTRRARATDALDAWGMRDQDLARMMVALSDPQYVSGWAKALAGDVDILDANEREAIARVRTLKRAASAGTGSAGGDWVPLQLDPSLYISGAGAIHPFRDIANVQMTSSNVHRAVSSSQVSASWDSEASEASDDATTLTETDVALHRLTVFIPYSWELSAYYGGPQFNTPLTSVLAQLIGDGMAVAESAAFTTGSGSGQPVGIVTALTGGGSVVASAGADTFAVADVYSLIEALPARFRSCAQWVASLEIINEIRQFGTADAHTFLSHLDADNPPALLGKPLHEASGMDGTYGAGENYVAVVGDWSNYVIAQRIGFELKNVDVLFGANQRPTGQSGLIGYGFIGADSVNDAAFRMLNVT